MIDEESLRGEWGEEKSEEKRMFSQATKSLFIHLFIY